MDLFNLNFKKNMRVYAFVGPSGTGKSYRAQMVASANNLKYIIDDGLLIKDNEVIAGYSAKKAATRIETVKHALFLQEKDRNEIINAIKHYKPDGILILGTSDEMVKKIVKNLDLPDITKTIYITDVASEQEMSTARRIRITEGKHVIPVPTFELKKDFSGYILDPLQIFKTKGIGGKPYISEKSIIRPTFSYLGNFTISDSVFRQIIEHLCIKNSAIYKIAKTRINNLEEGPYIYLEVIINYGYNIINEIEKFKNKCIKEIQMLTSMNVQKIEIVVVSIKIPEELERWK